MKIGILGGAFDPITKGHLAVAEKVLHSGRVDTVWLMPTYNHIDNKNTIDFGDRLHLCSQAIPSMKYYYDRVSVSQFERNYPEEASTWDLFSRLKKGYPQHDFSMIIGTDQAERITQWKNWEELIFTIPFIVVNRTGHLKLSEGQKPWYSFGPHTHLKVRTPWISSTMVRAAFESDDPELQAEIIENVPETIIPELRKFYKKPKIS